MIFLDERQVGFDPSVIGFPSIFGCHAVVLQTTVGLYGFHIVGGADTFTARSKAFAEFVKNHNRFSKKGMVHLFGTCFRSTQRGYADDKLTNWKAEMKSHAKALGYRGTVSGFDLDSLPEWPQNGNNPDSAYVEYRKIFGGCHIQVCPWHRMTASKVATVPDPTNRMTTKPDGSVLAVPTASKPTHTSNATITTNTSGYTYIRVTDLESFTC